MSNAAQQIAITPLPSLAPSANVEDFLVLPSDGVPVAVAVSYHPENPDNQKIVFSRAGQSGYGLSWQAGGYALMINFSFIPGDGSQITELSADTPVCWFSSTHVDDSAMIRQSCCVPPVPGVYHIGADVIIDIVNGTVKHIVDPVIVVTPIISSSATRARTNKVIT